MSQPISKISDRERKLITEIFEKIDEKFSAKHPIVTFINTVLTEGEKLSIGRRLLIAERLLAGQTRYEINNELRVSPNTITNTRQWLLGQIPEYSEVLKESEQAAQLRSQERSNKRKPREYIHPYSYAGMKNKYPLHFLLFSLAEELVKSDDAKK